MNILPRKKYCVSISIFAPAIFRGLSKIEEKSLWDFDIILYDPIAFLAYAAFPFAARRL